MRPARAITAATGADHSGVERIHVIEPKPWLTRTSRYVATHTTAAAAAPRLTAAVATRTGQELAMREVWHTTLA